MPDMVKGCLRIIANPSSRYDAEIKGIVNIKLKRNNQLGLRGELFRKPSAKQEQYLSKIIWIFLIHKQSCL